MYLEILFTKTVLFVQAPPKTKHTSCFIVQCILPLDINTLQNSWNRKDHLISELCWKLHPH